MAYAMSAEELRGFGAAWHEEGKRSAEAVEAMMKSGKVPGPSDQLAAILNLASAIDGLVGAVLTVGAAICERIEEKSIIETFN